MSGLKRLVSFAALLLVSCGVEAIPTPRGWIGAPTLHVSSELLAHDPRIGDALVGAAREYCERGYRPCVNVLLNSENGFYRAVLEDSGEPHGLPRAVASEGAGTIRYYRKHHMSGRDIVYTDEQEPCGFVGADTLMVNLRNVAIHEFGHLLGYDHTPEGIEYSDHVMYPSQCKGDASVWP